MGTKVHLHPALAQAMETWLDLDNPDAETREGLLGEAEACATVAFDAMSPDEVAETLQWLGGYVQKEDRDITHQLCDAANRDWSVSPEAMQELRAVMSTILITLQTLQARRSAPAWSSS